MTKNVVIDGAMGEGGGQVLRSSLALSLVTCTPFRIENIRANRKRPGLMRQHLTAVKAAGEIGGAEVEGAEIGSCEVSFRPHGLEAGDYHFAVGTAGSTTLVLQTVLPALILADGPSTVTLEGGTHNPFAPPFDFLAVAFLPLLNRMGPKVAVELERPGFYPAGGGRFRVTVNPTSQLEGLTLLERGEIRSKRGRAAVARLSRNVADRELKTLRDKLGLTRDELRVEEISDSLGPGNIVMVEIASEAVTEVFTGFGERGVVAEKVARQAADAARRYLQAGVPVGSHLADQLLLPMALAGVGSIRTLPPTRHTTTNIEVIRKFLDIDIRTQEEDRYVWRIDIGPTNGASHETK